MRHQLLAVVALLAIGGCTQTPGSLSPMGPSDLPSSPGPFQPVPDVLDMSDTNPCHWATRDSDSCSANDGHQDIPAPVVEDQPGGSALR
jgi:hypothetical protein